MCNMLELAGIKLYLSFGGASNRASNFDFPAAKHLI